jgi:Tol biopolymer transport system component
VDWDSAGEPSVVGGPDVVVELTELMDESVARSMIQQCDWEPGGDRLVYHYDQQELRLFDVGSESDTFLATGHDPWWAPDGSLIAYARAPIEDSGIWTVDPDSSGSDTLLLADGGKFRYHTPRWSPDSAHLCFSKASKSSVSIARVPVTGGSQTTVKSGEQPLAWR